MFLSNHHAKIYSLYSVCIFIGIIYYLNIIFQLYKKYPKSSYHDQALEAEPGGSQV